MTVASTTRKAGPFSGTGSQTAFPFSFKIYTKYDIAVTLTTSAGISSTLVLDSDYSVSVNANQDTSPGGTVTYPISGTALPVGATLTIAGNLAYSQTTQLPSGGAYNAGNVETALDRLTMLAQQLLERAARALSLPVSVGSGVSATLPVPSASKLIGWDSAATGLQNVDPTTLATIVAFGTANGDLFSGTGSQTVFTLSANPGALNNLDISVGGVTQRPGVDYTWSGGTTLTFLSAPPAGTNNIFVRYFQGLPQGYTDSAASTFLQAGANAVTRTVQAVLRDTVSVKDFGAKGNGSDDDTLALTYAHNAGVPLYYPPGTYIISSSIPLSNFQRIVGVPSESYIDWTNDYQKALPSYNGKASVIQFKAGSHGTIFSGNPGGVSIYGMVFRVGQVRTSADKLMTGMGSLGTFENCKFENIDTVFADPTGAYGAGKLIGNRFFANGGIASGALVDTVVIGNIFTSNGVCFSFLNGGGYFQMVGNRFEFNSQAIASYQSRSGIVTGNLFDCHNLAAIYLYDSNGWQVTGNKFNGNGLSAGGVGARSHVHLKGGTSGVTIAGNEFTAVRSDTGATVTGYILELESLSGKGNKFTGNSDEFGWITAPVVDSYASSTNTMIYDTISIPTGKGNPNTASDALHTYLSGLNSTAIDQVRVFIKEARLITNYVGFTKILMEGIGSSPIAMGNSSGAFQCQGMNNITYGSVTYVIRGGIQYASAQPNGFQTDGVWAVGQALFNSSAAAGGYIGWVKTAAGSPDTWKQFGAILP